MPRSVKQKRYSSRWANEAATLAKTLTKRRYDHGNNVTTQRTEETGVSPLPAVDEPTKTQATQEDNGRKNVSNLTIDFKDDKTKTRSAHRSNDPASDDSSSDEWRPYSRRRKRHKKRHPSGRKESTSSSTNSSYSPSERTPSTAKDTELSTHKITFTSCQFIPLTSSTDEDSDEGTTPKQKATRVNLDGTTTDGGLETSSSIKPYAVWSEFCAKLDHELKENRSRQDKLKAKLKYDANKTYKMYVAKKENALSKTKEAKELLGKTKSTAIDKHLPSSQSTPVEAKTSAIPLEESRGSDGLEKITSRRRVVMQVAKRTAMNLTTSQAKYDTRSVKRPALLTTALPKVPISSSAKRPPVSGTARTQSWTSEHRRRIVVQWLKTLQNPVKRTWNKRPYTSLTVPPLSQSTLPKPTPAQPKPNTCTISSVSDKGPEPNRTTQQSVTGADKAKNKDHGYKLESESSGISGLQNPSSQDPCEATSAIEKGTADNVLSKDTTKRTTKLQHSVWSSDSELDSSCDNKRSDQESTSNIEISKTTLEEATVQSTTTADKGNVETSEGVVSKTTADAAMASPDVSTCALSTQTSSINTPVEKQSSSLR
ncbi:Hypp4631 [Branchiostoma lanceolatum]|uniref:Hypp4631 protein n=1 Tax=Branchiostoma lanceolatum TaxID=7740 RepID=A0A8K0ACB8_BRALA|nr:Hypp4631 [Branchiostoma lanceolatum]